ncbi:MAG: extracellular solute-binding protein [Clostridia bacterium]|nr:extracellular solute-binding protein [Clostridia bacterium]
MKKRMLAFFMALSCLLLTGCTQGREEEKVQITWYMRTEDVDLYNMLEGVKKIEEATGVDVIFQSPPDNSADAYKMMVASGHLPDVIMWEYDVSTDRMYKEGTIIDLTDLIAEHAPNLMRIYTERPELRKEVETADGKLYYFPSINPLLTMEDICRKSYCGLIIRQDWLDKLGLEAPDTINDWYEVLTAFKNRDPNGNGYMDEIPFDGWGLPYFAPAFGVLNTFCVKPDGTVVFGPMEQEYKAYLETMNKWYAEGLLGSNCLIHSEDWKTENIVNDLTGSFAGLDNAWRYYLPPLQENVASAQLLAAGWPMNEAGVRYTPREEVAGHMASIVTVITSACKDPAAAVRFIDYMYSEEGSALLTWGVEGESYVVENGKKKLTELALTPDPDKGWLKLYYYAIGHASFPKYDGENVVLASYPEDQLLAEMTWADASAGLIYPPGITMSIEDKTFCDQVMEDVNNYITEMEMKFITGEEPLSNYDAFVAQLERMGVNDALGIYRRQYDAYMAR